MTEKRALLFLLLAALLLKTGYFLYGNRMAIFANEERPTVDAWFEIFSRNDSGWYRLIAEQGHHHVRPESLKGDWRNQSYYAFFPLFPLALAGIMALGLPFHLGGFVLVTALSLLAFYQLFRYLRLQGSTVQKSWQTVLLIMVFPFSYCFSVIYTESLFYLLLLAAFNSLARGKLGLFALWSALLVLVRPNGFIVIIPFALFHLAQTAWTDGKPGTLWKAGWQWVRQRSFLYFLASPLMLLSYCCYLRYMTGDFTAFATAQGAWGKSSQFPLWALKQTFTMGWKEAVEGTWTMLVMLLALVYMRRWPVWKSALFWLNTLLPLSAGSVQGMPRYTSILFPIHQQVATWFQGFRYGLLVFFCLILHALTFHFWCLGHPLSF